ncbi:MAG TPA: beta-L-arabinofuranosidase domain-containing protein [Clostridia bacterium]|nr:beta-L-arabinofuranosidase domain-containing protein [Clostridia bacterium]
MDSKMKSFQYNAVKLLPGQLYKKTELNRKYILSLDSANLLQNYYLEAGLWSSSQQPENIHWGWESPTSQLRGHFLGHWLSSASRIYAATGDTEVKGKADRIVSELARCQKENGGEWAGSIPEKYLDWIAKGKPVWAPHYTIHKTFMGLLEMCRLAGNKQALDVATTWAGWFHRWSGKFSREQFDDILDFETGGMLEIWADLYEITGSKEHYELLQRYYRRRLFDPLLEGRDVLTNMHANTTIPEVIGAARAWEVTGEQRWRDIVEAYWRMAVTERGTYCTGGQTCGEIWTPPYEMSARLGDKNQEHCTVYNMMRLAEFLFKWTGEAAYADYWERSLYNGILAQGYWEGFFPNGVKSEYPTEGLISYFLPLRPGSHKGWGTHTHDFWCCHGSLVQANASHNEGIYFEDSCGVTIGQYIPSELIWSKDENKVSIRQEIDRQAGSCSRVNQLNLDMMHRPGTLAVKINVTCDSPVEFELKLRLPWWLKDSPKIYINSELQEIQSAPSSFLTLKKTWKNDTIRVELPKGLSVCPLPDNPDVVAFMEGPVVLAGLCDEDRTLYGDKEHPETLLTPDNEREWENWVTSYRTYGQDRNIRFVPLYDIGYEKYSVYFSIKKP